MVSENGQQTRTESTRRYTRRKEGGGLAFFPYGFIPALGLFLISLFALFPFASLWIESNAEQAAMASLRQGGEDWARVDASGQWVTLTGTAPEASRAANAVALVKGARADAMFGRARPVTRIIDRIEVAAISVSEEALPALEDDAPVTMERMVEAEEAEPAADEPIETREAERVRICSQSLKDLLLDSKVKFATGSAQIEGESAPLLDQLASAMSTCGLRVTVEGHTDSTGSAAINEALSQARAEAVREALIERDVPAELLDAVGYGSAWPVAGNDTPEGREQNRRIEFSVRSLGDP